MRPKQGSRTLFSDFTLTSNSIFDEPPLETKYFMLPIHVRMLPSWLALKCAGRFYFFNTETKSNAWALDPSCIGGAPPPVQGATETIPEEKRSNDSTRKPSELSRIVEVPVGPGGFSICSL